MTSQQIMFTLQREVGEWSRANFGDQASKTHIPLVLGSVAPILGIFEEFGEMVEAMCNNNITLVRDSVADILIYLADYFSRCALNSNDLRWSYIDDKIKTEAPFSTPEKTAMFVLKYLGYFAHHNLKRHQGIRGYRSDAKFHESIQTSVEDLLVGLGRLYACTKREHFKQTAANPSFEDVRAYEAVDSAELLNLAWLEWQNVKQRNWKTNAITG